MPGHPKIPRPVFIPSCMWDVVDAMSPGRSGRRLLLDKEDDVARLLAALTSYSCQSYRRSRSAFGEDDVAVDGIDESHVGKGQKWNPTDFCELNTAKLRKLTGGQEALDNALRKAGELIYRGPSHLSPGMAEKIGREPHPKGIRFADKWIRSVFTPSGEMRSVKMWIPKYAPKAKATKAGKRTGNELGETREILEEMLGRLETSPGFYDRHRGRIYDLIAASDIENRNAYASRDNFGRFHTTFTVLSGGARLDMIDPRTGQRLACVDMTACHPLLVWVMAARDRFCPDWNISEGLRDRRMFPWVVGCQTWMMFEQGYKTGCENGSIYETLASWCRENGIRHAEFAPRDSQWKPSRNPHTFGTVEWLRWSRSDGATQAQADDEARAIIKRNMMVMLYSPDADAVKRMPSFKAIRSLYPAIAEFILRQKPETVKPKGKRSKLENDEANEFAHTMQRWDSLLMIDYAARQMIDSHPDDIFQTCHDAIYGPPRLVEDMAEAIEDACRPLGIRPTIKREAICTDCIKAGSPWFSGTAESPKFPSSKSGEVTCGECGRQLTW